MEISLFSIEIATLVAVLLSIVYSIGIVWRVEGELDISYKFFAFAIVFFFIAEVLRVYYGGSGIYANLFEKVSAMFFAILFLIGTLYMRDIVRTLDGEKTQKSLKKKK